MKTQALQSQGHRLSFATITVIIIIMLVYVIRVSVGYSE